MKNTNYGGPDEVNRSAPRRRGKQGEGTTGRNYITDNIRVKRVEDVEKGVVRACGTAASSRDHIALGMTTVKGVFAVG